MVISGDSLITRRIGRRLDSLYLSPLLRRDDFRVVSHILLYDSIIVDFPCSGARNLRVIIDVPNLPVSIGRLRSITQTRRAARALGRRRGVAASRKISLW